MHGRLLYFHFIPFAGVLADASVLIFLYFLPARYRFRTGFMIGYLGMASWNFLTFLNYVSDAAESYRLLYYVYFTFIHLIPLGFLFFSMQITQQSVQLVRRVMIGALLLTGLCLALLNLWFFIPGFESSFLLGMRVTPWGKAPVAGWGANFFHVSLYGSMAASYFFLLRYFSRIPGQLRLIVFLFILNAFGSLSNLVVYHGFDWSPPISNGVDAIVSASVAAVFFRAEYLRRNGTWILRAAGAFSAMGVTLVVMWIVAELFMREQRDAVYLLPVMLLASVLAMTIFQLFFTPASAVESFEATYDRLRRDFRLTHQEAMICRYVGEAKERKEILEILGISQNTLKVQLTSVYRKTIDRRSNGRIAPSGAPRKFVQLAAFVADLKES